MASLPGRYDIAIVQGADWSRAPRILSDGALLDTAGYTARAHVRASLDATVALEMTTANGRIAVGYDPPKWLASTAYAIGQQVVPSTLNGFVYQVVDDGVSGGAEPTWPTTIATTVVSGSVTFRCELADTGVTNLRLIVPAAVSSALSDWGLGVWDLELIDPYGHVLRLLEGQAVLSREVTR